MKKIKTGNADSRKMRGGCCQSAAFLCAYLLLTAAPANAASASAEMSVSATVVPYPRELITPEIKEKICSAAPDRRECGYVLHELEIGEQTEELLTARGIQLEYDPEAKVVYQTY